MTQYAVATPVLTAEVDGVAVEITSFACTFALNAIPTAQISLALGRNLRTNKLAASHRIGEFLRKGKPRVQVKLHLQVTNQIKSVDFGPPSKEPTVIFDGFVSHHAPSLLKGQVSITLPLIHWLGALDMTSAISGHSHPGNPADFTYPACFPQMGQSGGGISEMAPPGGGAAAWLPLTAMETTVGQTSLSSLEGMWGTIKKWLTELTNADPIDRRLANNNANKRSLGALEKMPNEFPSMLDTEGVDDMTAINGGIMSQLRMSFARNNINTTMWGKLVGEFCPLFMLAVVPTVNKVHVVPFTGPLANKEDKPHLLIKPSQYHAINAETGAADTVASLGICFPMGMGTGFDMAPGQARNELAAVFPGKLSDDDENGIVMIKEAPPWLSYSTHAFGYTQISTGLKDRRPIKTTIGGDGDEPPDHVGNAMGSYTTMMGRLAQQWFVIEKTKNRVIELKTYLRWDISPGMQVAVDVVPEMNSKPVTPDPNAGDDDNADYGDIEGSGSTGDSGSSNNQIIGDARDIPANNGIMQALSTASSDAAAETYASANKPATAKETTTDKSGKPDNNEDPLATRYMGVVVQVSHAISREGAITTLTLGYVRTIDEDKDERYSVEKPPLYKEGFYGTSLI